MSFRGDEQELPKSDLTAYFMKIWNWDGLPPAPKISHWMAEGSISIVCSVARKTSSVQWNGRHIGFDDINPNWPLHNLLNGRYDDDIGIKVSTLIPPSFEDWNNLGS